MKSIVLGAGCFWCTEAVFSHIKGVVSTTPGFSGGSIPNPSYERVCKGDTGHIEVVKVDYDEREITLDRLLHIFFNIHDPTSIDKQGEDVGYQYRSAIFYNDESDLNTIRNVISAEQKNHTNKIVTDVRKLNNFYPAEEYHKNYFERNPDKAYCRLVISPKVQKAKEEFPEFIVK
ncbi:MAG: peptide-methionine (S)-S-oxide reductase MsrA [Thermoplasmatales archaeon]